MNQRRSRSANWIDQEKHLFCSILKIYIHVLQNKSVNTDARNLKNTAWDAIYIRFNHLNFRKRGLNQLKRQWRTMKSDARKFCNAKEKTLEAGNTSAVTPGYSVVEDDNIGKLIQDNSILHDSDVSVISSTMKDPELETIVLDEDSTDSVSNADSEMENEEDWEMIYQNIFGNEIKSINSEKETPVQTSPATKLRNSEATHALKPLLVFSTSDANAPSSKNSNVSSELSSTVQLKIEEHKRRMEMAEELHRIDLQIRNEQLRAAILEREIMEMRKIKE